MGVDNIKTYASVTNGLSIVSFTSSVILHKVSSITVLLCDILRYFSSTVVRVVSRSVLFSSHVLTRLFFRVEASLGWVIISAAFNVVKFVVVILSLLELSNPLRAGIPWIRLPRLALWNYTTEEREGVRNVSMNFLQSINICDDNSRVMTQTNKRWIAWFAYINISVSTKTCIKTKQIAA